MRFKKFSCLLVVLFLLTVLLTSSYSSFAGVGGHIIEETVEVTRSSNRSSSSSSDSFLIALIFSILFSRYGLIVLGASFVLYMISKPLKDKVDRGEIDKSTLQGFNAFQYAFAGFVIGLIAVLKKANKQAKQDRMNTRTHPDGRVTRTVQHSDLPKVKDVTAKATEAIYQVDPNFDPQRFLSWSQEVFIKLNRAWTEKDWSLIRPFEHESLFSMHSSQLEEYIRKGQTNHLEKINVNQSYIYKYERSNQYESIGVALTARLISYVQEDETGKIVSGDKSKINTITYLMTFTRKLGVVTNVELSNQSTSKCPNCGGATEITSAGKCEYCQVVITTGDHDWVMINFDSLTLRTVLPDSPISITAIKKEVAKEETQVNKCSACGFEDSSQNQKKFCENCGAKSNE